jgi:shikimate dehydrogenase
MTIDNNTVLLGLIGCSLGHSLSPLMHSHALQLMNYNGIYIPFTVQPSHLEDAIKAMRALNIRGLNVTIPYKEKVIPYLDELSSAAQACGAVNAIINEQGKLIGHNMDGEGFIAGLKAAHVIPKGRILLLGAGGAARAVAYSLALERISSIDILARQVAQAEDLAHSLTPYIGTDKKITGHQWQESTWSKLSSAADIIINTTPVGMFPDINKCPVNNFNEVRPSTIICDIIYNPVQTAFLQAAAAREIKTINGLSMLIHQGALSLELWTGLKAPVEEMQKILMTKLY